MELLVLQVSVYVPILLVHGVQEELALIELRTRVLEAPNLQLYGLFAGDAVRSEGRRARDVDVGTAVFLRRAGEAVERLLGSALKKKAFVIHVCWVCDFDSVATIGREQDADEAANRDAMHDLEVEEVGLVSEARRLRSDLDLRGLLDFARSRLHLIKLDYVKLSVGALDVVHEDYLEISQELHAGRHEELFDLHE